MFKEIIISLYDDCIYLNKRETGIRRAKYYPDMGLSYLRIIVQYIYSITHPSDLACWLSIQIWLCCFWYNFIVELNGTWNKKDLCTMTCMVRRVFFYSDICRGMAAIVNYGATIEYLQRKKRMCFSNFDFRLLQR